MSDGVEFNLFIVGPDGTVEVCPVSTAVAQAYDRMVEDHLGCAAAASMAVAAERSGQDPVAFAEHFVKLRRAARGQGS